MTTNINPGNNMRTIFGVRSKLLASYSLIACTTVAACAIGLYSFAIIERSISKITVDSVPGMTSAMMLSQNSSQFENTISLLENAHTEEQRKSISTKSSKYIDSINVLANQLDDTDSLTSVTNQLRTILDTLNETSRNRINIQNLLSEKIVDMSKIQRSLNDKLLSNLDDIGFNLELEAEDINYNSSEALDELVSQIESISAADDSTIEILSGLKSSVRSVQANNSKGISLLMDPGVSNLRLILEYRANSNILIGLLTQVAQLDSSQRLIPVIERIQGVEAKVAESLEVLAAIDIDTATFVQELVTIGKSDDGIISLKQQEFSAQTAFERGLSSVRSELDQLMNVINIQVESSKQAVASASTESLAAIALSKKLLGIFAITCLVVTVLLIWLLVSRNIVRRLITVTNALKDISEGQLNQEINVAGRDELGELARTVDVFREKEIENRRLQEKERLANEERAEQEIEKSRMESERRQALEEKQRFEREQAERERQQAEDLRKDTDALLKVVQAASKGNLTNKITIRGEHPTGQLGSGLDTLIESFVRVMAQITTTTQIVASGTQEIVRGNSLLSERTVQQSTCLDDTTSSMKEITESANQNSMSAQDANELANMAQGRTQEVGRIVSEAVNAMNKINDSSKKISEIVAVIDDISFQTNLLALNASVEAARAGEQGRGFAVVASEVRNLSERSAVAAREIKNLIEDSVKNVTEGVKLVGKSETTLDELTSSVAKVTDIVADIADNAKKQTAGIGTVNKAVSLLEKTTQQNALMVEQVSSTSTEIAEQTVTLNNQINFFTFCDSEVKFDSEADTNAA